MEFQQPLPLQPGDKVAIVSPSSGMPFLFPWVYEQGLNRVREIFKLQTVEFPTARQRIIFLKIQKLVQMISMQPLLILPSKGLLQQSEEMIK